MNPAKLIARHVIRGINASTRAKSARITSIRPSSTSNLVKESENVIPSMYSDAIIPDVSFGDYMFEHFEKYANRVALINGETDQSFTYRDIHQQCTSLASALSRLDVTKGDVVGLFSPNCPEFLASMVAPSVLGASVTTINSMYGPEEIAKQLSDANASILIAHSFLMPNAKEALKMYGGIRHVISIGGAQFDDVIPMTKLFQDDGKGLPCRVQIDPTEDVFVLPYSSGTTGLPKGVMLTHHNIIANLCQVLHPDLCHIKYGDLDAKPETFIGVLPMYHSYGMTTLLFTNVLFGGQTVTMAKFTPQMFAAMLQKHKPTVLHTVPPILSALVRDAPPQLLQHSHTIMCGAAPVGPTLLEQFMKKFTWGVKLQEGYGMTEASPVTHMTPKSDVVPGSCGKSIPNTFSKLVDVETREVIDSDENTGELWIKGPQVMKGYLNNPVATKETISEDGWLCTGDIARIDSDDNVYIIDRIKELIKVKGLQVAPAELEDLLRQHPAVADVAVVGIPDERTGEAPRAFIVPVNESTKNVEDIQQFVEGRVAPHKKLTGGVVFLESIPKSPTGKILRRELR